MVKDDPMLKHIGPVLKTKKPLYLAKSPPPPPPPPKKKD